MMRDDQDRGVSDVIGFVLVFGLVATTVAVITVGGLDSLQEVRNAEQSNNAERAFDVLGDNMEDVFTEGAPSRATEISLTRAQISMTSEITVNVTWEDTSTPGSGSYSTSTVTPIVWESTSEADANVVYSLGAVIRDDPGEGGTVIREPPFILQKERVVIPMVRTWVDQPVSYTGSTVRVRGKATQRSVINRSTDGSYDRLWLNITTPRADTWQQYLDRKSMTDDCTVYDTSDGDKVGCEFETPSEVYITGHQIRVSIEG